MTIEINRPPSPQRRSGSKHFKRPTETQFTRDQRGHTTVLFGGLSWNHDCLIQGAWEGLGYRCEVLPIPDVKAFQIGKEYGNNGQCNPTYFTVGNLVQYLQRLEERGLSRQEIEDKYIFVTAGSCGPCRFGMYEAEYRMALCNAGFEGFCVTLFQQSAGLNQVDVEAGLEMNLDFFLGMLNAINIGDMLNEIGYMIRPYELNDGETESTVDEARQYLAETLRQQERGRVSEGFRSVLSKLKLDGSVEFASKFARQLSSDYYSEALMAVRSKFAVIEVDRFRIKPTVKVTGEFWAQTTEGDGNYNMFKFLENEGAEVIVEPIGTWVMYMMHQVKQRYTDRKGLENGEAEPAWWRVDKRIATEVQYRKRMAKITIAEKIFGREYSRLQMALGGGMLPKLMDQYELQRYGHPYYNSRAAGGEGHLEVAKNIYYSNKNLAHMVLSLKPFGCLPSTQSDGAQAAVTEHCQDMIYLPIETSGESEISAHSRVQMALGNARVKARQEFSDALDATGRALAELQSYEEEHPEMKSATYLVPKREDVVGRAANYVYHVAARMNADGIAKTESRTHAA